MYAYSRIKNVSTKRSKSLDLTNLPPHTPTIIISSANYYNSKPNHPNITRSSSTTTRLDPTRMLEQEHDEVGEVFGVILGRKFPGFSDSSSSDHDKRRSSFHSAVKRSFSMRRSASVAEGYRRMNRCCCHESSSHAADEDDLYISSAKNNSQKNHVKKIGKLLKVCRSLLGLM